MSKHRSRRKRRTDRQRLAHGPAAKRKHTRVGGRTGGVFRKYLRSLGEAS